jgi:hypothetical protein
VKVIETEFNGHRFRSRTEARWAVFFDAAGIKYEYEKEGFDLDGRWYLPDFWLPEIKKWVEVKGEEPTEEEVALCQKLQSATGSDVLLAVGSPSRRSQIIWFRSPKDYFGDEDHTTFRFHFADDRRNENEFWLVSKARDGSSWSSIGPEYGSDHGRMPLVHSATLRGYEASKAARFEHGEKPVPFKPRR